jgi:hypothetical protein
MLASFINTCFGALDPRRGHRPVFLQFETREPVAGAGMPDERDRNRVSVSKSICHSEFPESTRACARAQGSVHSESATRAMGLQIKVHNADTRAEIDAAFEAMGRDQPDAVFVGCLVSPCLRRFLAALMK